MSLDITMALVKAAPCGKFQKPMSFSRLLLHVNSEGIEEFVEVFVGSIALAKYVRAYYR